jgi:oxygen-independent coproporphyrinogen-3 oxidase
MRAILEQFKREKEIFNLTSNSIDTLFIGGGTPSTISPSLYEEFFFAISPYLKRDAEITTEANPNSATKEWLEGMKRLGVNRVSFGVQSFDEKKLKLLNRNHSKTEAIKAVESASDVGVKNISVDLIYSVKGDDKRLLERDIEVVDSLAINHISAYSLTIEQNTPFFNKPDMANESEEMVKWFLEKIVKIGFKQYEISNFGLVKSRHNLGYWRYEDYVGIGSGAVGFLKDRRFYTLSDVAKYIKDPNHKRVEKLTKDDMKTEKIFLGFRSEVGVDISLLNEEELKRADILLKEGKLLKKEGRLYNSDYLIADEIALFLLN